MNGIITPHQRLEAQIRLARQALLKAEGRWLDEHTSKQAAKLDRRRGELAALIAARRPLITVPGNWRV